MDSGVRSERHGDALHVVLDRPERRNALDEPMIAAMTRAISEEALDDGVRSVLLRGEGKSFCAGADLEYMRRQGDADEAENLADARRLGALFAAIGGCPRPVVARVHGAAIGGGLGLVAASDLVVADSDTKFGFTETRLGIVPGVISPFAVRRMGPAVCRRLFLTAEIFSASEAHRFGLVDEVCDSEGLDAAVDAALDSLRVAGPHAQTAAKQLLDEIVGRPFAEALEITPAFIARQRRTQEAREGIAAFFEKRPPRWRDRGEQS